jgi:UDP-2,4-diacetamido-2,4,6-trideoxy-beta-L-altropyranose hydrolase
MASGAPLGVSLLRDGDLTLREVTWADCRRLYDWRMHEQSRNMFRHTAMVPYSEHEALLRRYLAGDSREKWFIFEAGGVPVGSIGISDFSEDGTECEFGRLTVDPADRGKGYGTRGMRLALDHARASGVRRVHVEVFADNVPSLQLTHTLGFVETGKRVDGDRTYICLETELQ